MNIFIISITFIYILLFYLYYYIGSKYSSTYSKLTREEKLEWNVRINSTLNSTIATIFSFKVLFFDEIPEIYISNPYLGTTGDPLYLFQAVVAYFIYDSILMYIHPKPLYSKQMLLHHIIGTYNIYFGYRLGLFNFHLYVSLIVELSTPFVNMRWFLFVTKKSESLAYIINGIILAITFIPIRSFIFPGWVLGDLYSQWDQVCAAIPNFFLRWIWIGPFFILQPLNFYWSYLIGSGLIKALTKKRPIVLTDNEIDKKEDEEIINQLIKDDIPDMASADQSLFTDKNNKEASLQYTISKSSIKHHQQQTKTRKVE